MNHQNKFEINENNKDFFDDFVLQLQDMVTGFCPQGRITRLFQILILYN